MNLPSPLVPQGAIPPKTTSRPQRVLMIAAMVVGLHVAGLSLVLFQGCGKDGAPQTAGTTDTNSTAMSYPVAADTNPPSSMFASASNGAPPPSNLYVPPAPAGSFGAPTSATPPGFAGVSPDPTMMPAQPTVPEQPALTGLEKDYTIRSRDTLSGISVKHGITVGAIMRLNPNLEPMRLQVGQTIKLPAPTPAVGTASTPPTSTAAAAAAGGVRTYKVKPGDTLTRIARAHGITVNQLRAANGMKTTQVQAGKVLKIPAGGQRTAAAPGDTNTH